jgi:hypothetical protein
MREAGKEPTLERIEPFVGPPSNQSADNTRRQPRKAGPTEKRPNRTILSTENSRTIAICEFGEKTPFFLTLPRVHVFKF